MKRQLRNYAVFAAGLQLFGLLMTQATNQLAAGTMTMQYSPWPWAAGALACGAFWARQAVTAK
ncbi:hypothetical protein HNP46_005791 [Pseudomonas nitritireducens]|uniref:Uncharacterized protein n=1 Tax=Pseudomonas nitroreducens TaxID=46680 RepID=A0A7W7P4H1_PSENT|nr:hypothetical protein [Pseudomonas nitritireducens]MBB4866884.1 hypothetical protein [Pseudomonas nitritireducens]